MDLSKGDEICIWKIIDEDNIPVYYPGDLLLIKRRRKAKNGEAVVIISGSDIIIGNFFKLERKILISSFKPGQQLKEFFPNNYRLFGSIIGLYRRI